MKYKTKSDTYNEAVSKFMHLHLLKYSNTEKYRTILLEIISLCQKAIRENQYDGDAHIMLANSLYLATLPPLPGKHYTYFLPLAAAVIGHWKLSRLASKERANGEILFEKIDQAIKQPVEYWNEAMPLEATQMDVFHQKYYHTAISEEIDYPNEQVIRLASKTVDPLLKGKPDWVRQLLDIIFVGFYTKQIKGSNEVVPWGEPHFGELKKNKAFIDIVDWAAAACEKEYGFCISEATVIVEKFQAKFGRVPVKLLEEVLFELIIGIVYLFRRGEHMDHIKTMIISRAFVFRKFDQGWIDQLKDILNGLVIFSKDRLYEIGALSFEG